MLHHFFSQAALVASQHNPVLKILADRLRAAGKPHMMERATLKFESYYKTTCYLVADHGLGVFYTQLSLQERRRIEDWCLATVPVAEMARLLKRHKSTIYREIKRNFWTDDAFPKKYAGYFGMAAHLRTQ